MCRRIENLLEKLKNSDLDGFLVNNPANVSYLSRFKNSESYLIISPKENFFITDFRYTQEAKSLIKGFKIFRYGNLFQDIASITAKLKIKRLGFESKNLSFAEYSRINSCLNRKVKFIDTFNLVEALRQTKDADELKYIRQAVSLTGETFKFIKKRIKPGIKELEIAGEIERFIRYKGARQAAFDIIVASGPNSSYPHASASDRKIRSGEPLLIDIGVNINGYKSDLTRVFFLDRITPILRKIYGIILKAQAEGLAATKPGAKIKEIDLASRKYIAKCGYGPQFGHSLGHGVGLEVHEEPSVSFRNNSLAQEGMVITIEPGIYLPGKFGIRLEDMVLITKKGAENLSVSIDKSI